MVFQRASKWKTIIAEYQRIEQMLRHLGMVTEQAVEGIVVVDLKGIVHFVNTAWAKMHGYKTSSELVGKPISEFHTEGQMKTHVIPLSEEAKCVGLSTGTAEHLRRDGTTFQTLMKIAVVKDEQGKADGLIVFISDVAEYKLLEETLKETTKRGEELKGQIAQLQHEIMERRQAEDELKEYRDQLEQRIKEQTAELTAANEQLRHQITEREQAEESLKQQVAKVTEANEQLRHQITEREQAEESLKQQVAEVTEANEQLRHQITEREQAEESLKQQVAEVTEANERLQHQITEREEVEEMPRESAEQAEASKELSGPFNVEELKAIAESAKRLGD